MSRHRGSIIVAVLLLLAIGVVMASGVLVASDAAATVSSGEMSRAQARSLAWSGVQGVMAELADQRDLIIGGADPDLTEEWALFTTQQGERGVIRLIDLNPSDPTSLVVPENAKLNLNTATPEMLTALTGLSPTAIDAIMSVRQSAPFTSVEELLAIDGIDADTIYGSADDQPAVFAPVDTDPAGPPIVTEPLTDLLTVFAFDPNVQVALDGRDEFAGDLRVNVNQPWSDGLYDAIAERLDSNAADFVRGLMEGGMRFEKESDIAAFMLDQSDEVDSWPDVFDVFTTSDDEFLPGRVDVNRAPEAVLACLPGIGPDLAPLIIDAREALSPEQRRSPVWPALESILSPDEMQLAIDHLTTRSTQWRVRLEAGIEPADPIGAGGFDEREPMSLDDLVASWDEPADESTLRHRMVIEAVIDIASSRPRVAYMREITMLHVTRQILAANAVETDPPFEAEPLASPDQPLDAGEPMEDPAGPDADLDLDPIRGGDERSSSRGDEVGSSGGSDESDQDTRKPAVDRRIGRWTTRKAEAG